MIDLNPEIVCFIIGRAQEFHAKEGVVLPSEQGDGGDWAMQALANHASDPTFAELKATIGDLEPDQQAILVAMMWLGRGDYAEDEWEEALAAARDAWNPRVADYLIGTPLVSDYLLEGLNALGYSCDGE
jgi:Protein of unknown function (DUF3775)